MHSLQEQRVFRQERCLPAIFQVLCYLADPILPKLGRIPYLDRLLLPTGIFPDSWPFLVVRLTEESGLRLSLSSWGSRRGCPLRFVQPGLETLYI